MLVFNKCEMRWAKRPSPAPAIPLCLHTLHLRIEVLGLVLG